jgi:hypothetical protein
MTEEAASALGTLLRFPNNFTNSQDDKLSGPKQNLSARADEKKGRLAGGPSSY